MYDYLKGTLVQKIYNTPKGNFAVVEVNDVGFLIDTNQRVLGQLGEVNSQLKIYTSLVHKEDSMQICGFTTREDRDIFNILQSVSGIGVKVALILLDEFSGYELISAVIHENSKELSRAKGVGSKLAQKIILELKDKLINWQKVLPINLDEITDVSISNETIQEAQAVLLSLGYSIEETKTAIKLSLKKVKNPNNSEEILKEALQYLALGE